MNKSLNVTKKQSIKPTPFFASTAYHDINQVRSIDANSAFKASVRGEKSQEQYSPDKPEFSLKSLTSKAKSSVIIFIKNKAKGFSFSPNTVEAISALDRSSTIDQLFEGLFDLLHHFFSSHTHDSPQEKNEKDMTFALRSREAKIIRLVREQATVHHERGKSTKFQELKSYNDSLKKQIFTIREEKQQIQKKMLELIEEYKNRKTFYMAEIKKLTDIINMSSFDVRNLVLEKTKQAKQLNPRPEPRRDPSAVNIRLQDTQFEEDHKDDLLKLPLSPRKQTSYGEIPKHLRGYNTEIRVSKGFDNFDELKTDNNMLY